MKKLSFLALAIFLLSLTGCGQGAENVDVGKWAVIELPNGDIVEGEIESLTRWSDSALRKHKSSENLRCYMIDQIFWWLGFITCVIGALCGLALLAWLAGNAWIDASRKWRSIFRAENNIIDYIQHRTEFERWKREQEALYGKTD